MQGRTPALGVPGRAVSRADERGWHGVAQRTSRRRPWRVGTCCSIRWPLRWERQAPAWHGTPGRTENVRRVPGLANPHATRGGRCRVQLGAPRGEAVRVGDAWRPATGGGVCRADEWGQSPARASGRRQTGASQSTEPVLATLSSGPCCPLDPLGRCPRPRRGARVRVFRQLRTPDALDRRSRASAVKDHRVSSSSSLANDLARVQNRQCNHQPWRCARP